jgi:hypothetical protein
MHISPRLRPALSHPPRLPAAAVMPLLATCALTAGLGVGILWGASQIGGGAQTAEPPVIAHAPAPVASVDARPSTVQPAIAQALAASDEAFQLVSPPPIVLDPFKLAQSRAEVEAPFAIVVAAPAAPVRVAAAAPTVHPATADVTGRMAKIAPSSDGLPTRVRAQPTTAADIVARIPSGTALRVLGPADGARDWVRVTWNGITGYIRADLVR